MLKIQRFICNPLRENTYVISDETKECMIVDCGAYYEAEKDAIKHYIEGNGLKVRHLLATHGHIDHNLGDKFVFDNWGVKPEVGTADGFFFDKMKEQAKAICGLDDFAQDNCVCVGKYLDEHDPIELGTHKFTILPTPGHTPGGMTFYCKEEHVAFTGDTLFHGSIGRTDFEGGSMFMMVMSLRHLSQLPDDVRVMPGHGSDTTIGEEVASNPYIDR